MHRATLEASNLGEYAHMCSCLLRDRGWNAMILALQSDSDFHPAVHTIQHPAVHVLDHLCCHGAPVLMSTQPWTDAHRTAAIAQGSHLSARQHLAFLEHEMLQMVNKGQWIILPYHEVAHIRNLRISPLGVVPQRDRRPRTIADYTFLGINANMVNLTGHLPLQFGHALLRILQKIVTSNPAFSPVYIIKLDLADGFYRIHLAPRHIPSLGVAFPTRKGKPPLVAFPLALPMGWTSLPLLFCAATETVADLTNQTLGVGLMAAPHRLEQAADPLPPNEHRLATMQIPALAHQHCANLATEITTSQPLAWSDVFVDDHVALAQGSPAHLQQVRRTLLHSIDCMFCPLHPTDCASWQEPVSQKKLATGNGQWSMQHTVLGWLLDTKAHTITLPDHRAAHLHDILAAIPRECSRISTRHWHQLLGELCSMTLALPGSRGLFSTLQEAF